LRLRRVVPGVNAPAVQLDADDFAIFGLERRFALDEAALDARRKALQAQVHPDRFVTEGAASQRRAVQWSVRVNEAALRLKNPVRRAAYLCELAGVDLAVERNTAMPAAFLMQQMAWREALEEAASVDDVQRVAEAVAADRERWLQTAQRQLDDEHNPQAAAESVRALMFVDRFLEDIDRRLDALDAAAH
jgi:molecular chaperone HscB